MDLPDRKPEPCADELAPTPTPTPLQRRARRRRLSRRAMTLVTWSLVFASGLLVLQHMQARGASARPRSGHEGVAPASTVPEAVPSLRTETSVHGTQDFRVLVAPSASEAEMTACGVSTGGCGSPERGVPLKPSHAMPPAEEATTSSIAPAAAAAATAASAEAPPLHIDAAETGAPTVSEECRQVAEEIQSIAAALRDAVGPEMREGLQRRGREADNRQFFLHCLS